MGEFGLIARITDRLDQGEAVLLGPGDDAALLRAPDGRVVVTMDLLVEGRHFRRDWSPAADVGRKAAAQNLADVAAMGATPTALVVGLGLPGDLDVDWVDALVDGMSEEASAAGAAVAGGDVVAAESVVIAVTALGDLGGRAPLRRSGARPGDRVALAGRTGWAAAGLALLEARDRRRGGAAAGPALPGARDAAGAAATLEGSGALAELVAAHARPRPPYAAGPRAAEAGATALIDVSDGLAQDLGHIARASGVRVVLDPAALPVPPVLARAGELLGVDPVRWVLTGGEDHALAATFPAGVAVPAGWRVIGEVRAGTGVVLAAGPGDDPAVTEIGDGGWDHFRAEP